MNYVTYIIKFLFRIKWWLILFPTIVAYIVYLKMGIAPETYKSTTTIFTGIVSGYDIETNESTRQDWNVINNAMDNLINIIMSQTTLKNVSMRLYAQGLVHGDPNQDNEYITAKSYRTLLQKTPDNVKALVDRNSDSITLMNLENFEAPEHSNHVYGIFRWEHPHYSYQALSKIKVRRLGSSDLLEISYENDDPKIVYNTLDLLNKEFVKQYRDLRFGETNNVIKYFENELKRVGDDLRDMEDSLTKYNVEKQVINYDEQTKHIAALSRDYELRLEEILLSYNSAKKLRETLESQLNGLQAAIRSNTSFITQMDEIASLQSRLSAAEAFREESKSASATDEVKIGVEPSSRNELNALRKELDRRSKQLKETTDEISQMQNTKEGISASAIVTQWLDAMLLEQKSKVELEVMKDRKMLLDEKYTFFSPIGSTLKRKNRAIDFSENSYLSTLQALNTARLRQKNLQMTSATLKVINPPIMPIKAEPGKRSIIVPGVFVSAFLFILGIFILLEILDRTLRDKVRAERIVGGRVIGAFPGPGRFSERRYAQNYREISSKFLGNAVLNYLSPGKSNILNILSTEPGDGKTTLMENLAAHFRETGMKVRVVSWNNDFNSEHKNYLLAEKLSDFIHDTPDDIPLTEADLILVEHPSFATVSVPKELLKEAALNLLVIPANRTWSDTDQQLYDKTVELTGKTPLTLCLNYAKRTVVQSFTGLMPPYSWTRRIGYQISQFGFTAVK